MRALNDDEFDRQMQVLDEYVNPEVAEGKAKLAETNRKWDYAKKRRRKALTKMKVNHHIAPIMIAHWTLK